ncbi:Gamma-glutamyl phosphate reductase [Entomobacter blattae]|uniref:Gamma-glutamyl phosphate reductase n=1 Tax=Entomobacter blattae TaxID=2762277 RepID=A0A7H1NQX8_9PROT|nr:Gamma-glutamyl phosphate reductase [Entomobacter blattae]
MLTHAEGLCHIYIHTDAELEMARKILLNAKMRRGGICGATETLLIDEVVAPSFLPVLVEDVQLPPNFIFPLFFIFSLFYFFPVRPRQRKCSYATRPQYGFCEYPPKAAIPSSLGPKTTSLFQV